MTPVVHTDHCLRNWKRNYKLKSRLKHGQDNAGDFLQELKKLNNVLELQVGTKLYYDFPSQQFVQQNKLFFLT